MAEHRGWFLDLYEDAEQGLRLWFLGEDGERVCFYQSFPVTFYVTGSFSRLRQLWQYLQKQPIPMTLARTRREDLFAGMLDVMAVEVGNPQLQSPLFREVLRQFPDLTYYDGDIPACLRYAAKYDVFPLMQCQVVVDDEGQVETITPLESRWQLEPTRPSLTTLLIEPNCDPAHESPTHLLVTGQKGKMQMNLKPQRLLLIQLNATLNYHDPDILLTRYGDTWLFPMILKACRAEGVTFFNPNRDKQRQVQERQENSYSTYGQVVYRGRQAHLFGRWHIDVTNAMMYNDYGLEGVFEQARVTGLPVQEIARKSPGAGITAMQIITALKRGVLVPHQKQQSERFKTARELIRADRGGLVYQPLTGLHEDVAEIDFISMYPSIMVHFNISPETVGQAGRREDIQTVPELGIGVDQSKLGLVPETLRPLLAKRLEIKQQLAGMNHQDCRYKTLKARATALKWLLVVCFGYLGYKNARFGRIESHEAVTAYGREALLRAKEAAEDLGFTVLHMYVDGLWVKRRDGETKNFIQPLLDEIVGRTGLPIALEGVYKWIAFLPSRLDERVPVANRYFGLFQDGVFKMRGIEVRRHDTVPFVAQIQRKILERMGKVADGRSLPDCLPDVMSILRQGLADLQAGRVPIEQLIVAQTLSRTLAEYRVPSPAARAAMQLEKADKARRPGQRIKFIYTHGEPGVYAWDCPEPLPPAAINVVYYSQLLIRATSTVLQPLGMTECILHDWLLYYAYQPGFHSLSGSRLLLSLLV